MTGPDDRLLADQVAYYRARAPEYDRWWERTHQYELTPDLKAQWDADAGRLEAAIAGLLPRGSVLELACGTGIWTAHLTRFADHVTAVDASPEVIAINRARVARANVTYREVDLFGWEPEDRYDVVFFSFWLSHVPPARVAAFWSMVAGALRPGGRAIFIDNALSHRMWPYRAPVEGYEQDRTDLSDGRRFRIVKVYYEPAELEALLASLGWDADVTAIGDNFIYGSARPRCDAFLEKRR